MNKLISTVVLGAALTFSSASIAATNYFYIPNNKLVSVVSADKDLSSVSKDKLDNIAAKLKRELVKIEDTTPIYNDEHRAVLENEWEITRQQLVRVQIYGAISMAQSGCVNDSEFVFVGYSNVADGNGWCDEAAGHLIFLENYEDEIAMYLAK